jgi:hypothetical protein
MTIASPCLTASADCLKSSLHLLGRGISKILGSEVAIYIASECCCRFRGSRAKCRLTNLRRGILTVVDQASDLETRLAAACRGRTETSATPWPPPATLKIEITVVGTLGTGSSLSTVGGRCRVHGFPCAPRDGSAPRRTVNALISRTSPSPAR